MVNLLTAGNFVKKPVQEEYICACNEFWWCLNNVAKGLWRGEMTYVQHMVNHVVRIQLEKLLSWKVGLITDWSVSAGKSGNLRRICGRSILMAACTDLLRICRQRLSPSVLRNIRVNLLCVRRKHPHMFEVRKAVFRLRLIILILYVGTVFVDEEYRRRGIGTMLMAEVEHRALALGADTIRLDTFNWQGSASISLSIFVRFSASDGFVRLYSHSRS